MNEYIAVDSELLELAEMALRGAGYSTRLETGVVEMLLAENRFAVVIVSAGSSVSDLFKLEPILTEHLVAESSTGVMGSKRWDLYVVLLTTQSIENDSRDWEPIFSMAYDTRYARRYLRTGLAPTLSSVQAALRPLLPMEAYSHASVTEDPLG